MKKLKLKNFFSISLVKRIRLLFKKLKAKKHQNIFQIFSAKRPLILLLIFVTFLIIFAVFYFWISFSKRVNNIRQQKSADAQSVCLSQVGYTWCVSEQKCLRSGAEFCNDDIVKLVTDINKNTETNFVDQGQHNFAWRLKVAGQTLQDKSVAGEEYTINNVKLAKIKRIENYLSSVTTLDQTNIINGVSGGLRGYRYRHLVCTLNFRYQAMKVNAQSVIVPVADRLHAKFNCGPAPSSL